MKNKNGSPGTLGLRACAAELGIDHKRLQALVNEGRVPRNADGSFDAAAVKAAFDASRDPAQASKISPEAEVPAGRSFAGVRTDREEIKARRERLELDLEEGRLVRADRMRQELFGLFAVLKGRMLGMGPKLAPRLAAARDPVAAEEIVSEEVYLILSVLSKWESTSQPANASS